MLIYKQRHQNSNKHKTAKNNYHHIKYIATRPRVMKNEQMEHGLFGKLEIGEMQDFKDWKEISELVEENTKAGITMYRGIVSPSMLMVEEFDITNQERFKDLVEKYISIMAKGNGIKREDLAYVAAAHNEKDHPHVHIAFWDKRQKDVVRNPFVHKEVPKKIRTQMIKESYGEKILEFSKVKDENIKSIRNLSDDLAEKYSEFRLKTKDFTEEEMELLKELDYDFGYDTTYLDGLTKRFEHLRNELPLTGRLYYKLLDPPLKQEVDEIAYFIIKEQPEIKDLVDQYVTNKMSIVKLYLSSETTLNEKQKEYEKEIVKIIGNKILASVKQLDRNNLSKDHGREVTADVTFSIVRDLTNIMKGGGGNENGAMQNSRVGKLDSVDVRKELMLKNKDKGFEH